MVICKSSGKKPVQKEEISNNLEVEASDKKLLKSYQGIYQIDEVNKTKDFFNE